MPTMDQMERRRREAFKIASFHEAYGCSWKGRRTPRNGKTVICGHKHKTYAAAEACARKMRETRPGKCQTYRVRQIELHYIKKSRAAQ